LLSASWSPPLFWGIALELDSSEPLEPEEPLELDEPSPAEDSPALEEPDDPSDED